MNFIIDMNAYNYGFLHIWQTNKQTLLYTVLIVVFGLGLGLGLVKLASTSASGSWPPPRPQVVARGLEYLASFNDSGKQYGYS